MGKSLIGVVRAERLPSNFDFKIRCTVVRRLYIWVYSSFRHIFRPRILILQPKSIRKKNRPSQKHIKNFYGEVHNQMWRQTVRRQICRLNQIRWSNLYGLKTGLWKMWGYSDVKKTSTKAHIELADREVEKQAKILNKRCNFRRPICRKLDDC